MGAKATFPASLCNGYAQFGRGITTPKTAGFISSPPDFNAIRASFCGGCSRTISVTCTKYSGWGWADNQWGWDNVPTPITPPAETWGELTLRRLDTGRWILGGFLSSGYCAGISHDRLADRRSLRRAGSDASGRNDAGMPKIWPTIKSPNCMADMSFPAHSWMSRAALAWWSRSGTPRPAGRTGRCSSR